ncbi:hypothetical protein J1N35_040863 [Gossypium stocksii]|uniref:Uncharacterized protein n=1 Tax=Gossypium stocksii TaxID=47602 RepID=A0A9D3UEI0_9ROSI|nr:hypothetical protein J1N35_040863 [Gossypium stocksii]
MHVFPEFPKELQVSVEKGTADRKPIVVKPRITNPTAEKEETKSFDEDEKKTELVQIEADDDKTEETYPTLVQPEDRIIAVPPISIEPMTKQSS